MNELIQYAFFVLGMLSVVKVLISDLFEIIDISISKLDGIVTKIKKLKKNIKR